MVEYKRRIQELAIFGGHPSFPELRHVGRPNIPDRERLLGRIEAILNRKWLTNNGPVVQEFERTLAEQLGVRHCLATCNATVGLEIALKSLGLQGEVIVPAFTFVATVHALPWLGIDPVFCDVDSVTHNIDPDQVEALITERTSAILGVHLWGRPCPVEALSRIARKHDLTLLFDAAHAMGCSLAGNPIGSFGSAEIFSFHATKFINCFEGGAITTNDDELAGRIRLHRNFGFAGLDQVVSLGTNGKMNEVSAAMGLTCLETKSMLVQANQCKYRQYQHNLDKVAGVKLIEFDENENNNFQYIVLEVDSDQLRLTRDQLHEVLRSEGILARRYFFPGCHNMEP